MKTSFLSLMTAQMAEELTGQSNAAAILSELHANNYFVALRRTSPQLVYQVHPLFRDFLRSRVRGAFERKSIEDLQRAAAILLEKAGQLEDAIRVLCDIPDWALLMETVNTHAELRWSRAVGGRPWLNGWRRCRRMSCIASPGRFTGSAQVGWLMRLREPTAL